MSYQAVQPAVVVAPQEPYCGPISWIIGCFLCPCIIFCPVDKRPVVAVVAVQQNMPPMQAQFQPPAAVVPQPQWQQAPVPVQHKNASMFCGGCGVQLAAGAQFCNGCGSRQ